MKHKKVSFQHILDALSDIKFELTGAPFKHEEYAVSSLSESKSDSLVWYKGDDVASLSQNKSTLIICGNNLKLSNSILKEKTFILVENPKLVISQVISKCFIEKEVAGVHKTATVEKGAVIGKNVYIGPYVYVGNCVIGDNVVLSSHIYIHDNVTIKNNVEIHAGCVIGDMGSGYARNDKNEFIKFPHIGGVIIEDNVEIGANTYINRGALSDTIIRKGAKIGNSVCIGHNVEIGKNTIVIANSVVAGSTVVGENCWIAHSSTLRNGIIIDDDVTIGMGSVVTKSIRKGQVVFGNPAKSKNK